jgi:hypothetical protein
MSKAGAIALWLLFALITAGIVLHAAILPPLEAGWRAHGVLALPWTWQVAVDWADFSMHRGAFVALPLLMIAVVVTKSAFRRILSR